MLPRLGKLTVVVLLVFCTGAHWLFLQSVAWVTMTVSFAQTDPLPVAIQRTFDGRHPCGLCKIVAEGKKEERKQETLQIKPKLELFFELKTVWLEPPSVLEHALVCINFLPDRTTPPPTPPPRLA